MESMKADVELFVGLPSLTVLKFRNTSNGTVVCNAIGLSKGPLLLALETTSTRYTRDKLSLEKSPSGHTSPSGW